MHVGDVASSSSSPVSSQSTVDIDVSKSAAAPCGVIDPAFNNPSIDLSSLAHSSTPHSGMLSTAVLNCDSLSIFKSRLKTHMFSTAFC